MSTNTNQPFTPEQIELIKRQIAPKATDDELKMFIRQCERTGLDPFARQIYCIHRKGKMTIQVSIDGFRLIAERTKQYGGQSKPIWEFDSNNWPISCEVTVYKFKGSTRYEAAVGVAYFAEYVQMNDKYENGQLVGRQMGEMWAKMPRTMIAKVAEALALRKAFPQELSGLYTDDEMQQADAHTQPMQQETQPPLQLPVGTAVPFTPQYTQQAPPVAQAAAGNQQQQQQQAPPPPNAANTAQPPAANSGLGISAQIDAAKTKQDLLGIYNANSTAIMASEQLKAQMKKKEQQIENGGKVIINDELLSKLIGRINDGEMEAYDNALKTILLTDSQKKELDAAYAKVNAVNQAIEQRGHTDPVVISQILNDCTTTQQVMKLHQNNNLIIDRDPKLLALLNDKLKKLKKAA